MTHTYTFAAALLGIALSALACGDELEPGRGPGTGAADRYLFVANASVDFQTASYARVDLEGLHAHPDLGSVHADSAIRWTGGYLFALNRLGADNVQRIDPQDMTTRWQYSTGAGSNPQDILVVDVDKAYVTLYEDDRLLIVDPDAESDDAFVLGTVDLSAFADADGIPEMAAMVGVGDRAYVALQRLDRDDLFAPTHSAYLVGIDTDRDEVVELSPDDPTGAHLELPYANPTMMRRVGDEIWIGCAGRFGEADGAIVRYDTATGELGAPVVTEETLGGDLAAFTDTSPVYVLWTDSAFANHLSVVDDAQVGGEGAVTRELLDGLAWVADLEADDQRLYVPDRAPTNAGVRVFSRSDFSEVTVTPISTGLPPWSIEIVSP